MKKTKVALLALEFACDWSKPVKIYFSNFLFVIILNNCYNTF